MTFRLDKLPRWLRDITPLLFWLALIFVLSDQPVLIVIKDEVQEKFFYKVAHVIAYAVLAWLWWRALAPQRQFGWPILSAALTLTILYGISDEIHQLFVPGRHAQLSDVLFDTSGALAMILFVRQVSWLRAFPENLPVHLFYEREQGSSKIF